ncbi:MAG: hypothetical protein IPK53_11065 [bacterium]|nr:hypothetical protein [bacterium]
MNALVEDQMQRLRKALDSDEAHQWLNEHRGNNRFYFGRYRGKRLSLGQNTIRKRTNPETQKSPNYAAIYKKWTEPCVVSTGILRKRSNKAKMRSKKLKKNASSSRTDGGEMLSRWICSLTRPTFDSPTAYAKHHADARDQEEDDPRKHGNGSKLTQAMFLPWLLTNCICIAAHRVRK